MKKRGRPTKFSDEIATAVCEWLEDGKPLREFCRQPGMPAFRTVYYWREAKPEFSARFARAREIGFDVIAEEALHIANTPCVGETVTEEEGPEGKVTRKVVRQDMLGHRKLQFDARLKLLAKWDPRRYGDRVEIEHTEDADLAEELRKARERYRKRAGE